MPADQILEATGAEVVDELDETVVDPAPEPEPDDAPTLDPEPEPVDDPTPDLPAQIQPTGRVPGLAVDLPVIPGHQEIRDIASLAVTLANADAVPAALRQRPNDVFLVLVTARDLGVSLTTAMREFHVIEGKVTISPKVKLAMVRTSGLGRIWPDAANDARSATWHAQRDDLPGQTFSSTYTIEEADAAKLLGKDNWKKYPAQMLKWRAVGYLIDDIFGEVATGLYSPDELGALTDDAGEPIEVSAVETPPGMRNRTSPAQAAQAAAEQEAQGPDEATSAELDARLALVKKNDAAQDELKAWWAERRLPPKRALTARQATTVLARLNALETKHQIPKVDDAGDPPAEPASDAQDDAGAVETTFADEPEQTVEEMAEGLAKVAQLREAGDVTAWIIERGKLLGEASIKRYAEAREIEAPDGNLQALRRWWCEQEIEATSLALSNALASFLLPRS